MVYRGSWGGKMGGSGHSSTDGLEILLIPGIAFVVLLTASMIHSCSISGTPEGELIRKAHQEIEEVPDGEN